MEANMNHVLRLHFRRFGDDEQQEDEDQNGNNFCLDIRAISG